MSDKRIIEIFSGGCPVCQDTIEMVTRITCSSCEVRVLDMNDDDVSERAKKLGIRSVPTVVINGQVAECCSGRGPDEETLKAAGVGTPF